MENNFTILKVEYLSNIWSDEDDLQWKTTYEVLGGNQGKTQRETRVWPCSAQLVLHYIAPKLCYTVLYLIYFTLYCSTIMEYCMIPDLFHLYCTTIMLYSFMMDPLYTVLHHNSVNLYYSIPTDVKKAMFFIFSFIGHLSLRLSSMEVIFHLFNIFIILQL